MKKRLFLVFWGLVCGVFLNAQAQTLDEAILRAALRIGADLPANATVAVIHFRSDSEKISDYVITELHGAILRNRRLTPVKPDATQLQSIRDELRFNEAGDIDGESAQSIGQLLKVAYLLSGSIESSGSGYEILFTAVDAQSAELKSRYSAAVNPGDATLASLLGVPLASAAPPPSRVRASRVRDDTWKNKWLYLGGSAVVLFADGSFASMTPLFVLSEFALLPFFSMELDFGLILGQPPLLFVPILAKLGGRFGQVELFFDIGYSIGLGFTLGGTFGIHAGRGILFVKMFGKPPNEYPSSGENLIRVGVLAFSLGYKGGLVDKKKKAPQAPQPETSGDEVPQTEEK